MRICGPARRRCLQLSGVFEQLLLVADQLLRFLQRVIEIAVQDVVVDAFDEGPCARHRGQDVAHQAEIGRVMGHRVRRQIHQLHGEIDQLGRRVGGLGRQDVLLAQDRNPVAVDQQPGALIGIGDDAGADDDSLVRLEFDFQGHACSPFDAFRCRCPPADSHPFS